ncbi:hypothetical protein MMC26_002381 [Xylographa opegraphella]|nr:hypothetical protein [Xylographa opegraphella]
MPPRISNDKVIDSIEDIDDTNEAKVKANSVLSSIYGDLHRRSTKIINFNAQNPSQNIRSIILPIDYVRAKHGFRDDLPDEVEKALELLGRFDHDPKTDRNSRELQRTMIRWNIVADYSIMMLSMLAFSTSFRNTVEQCTEDMWALICAGILENHESIEYFAKARGLQWKDLLERYHSFSEYVESVQTLGEKFPGNEVQTEHPHSRVVPQPGGRLRVPTAREDPKTPQTVIDENVYDEKLWLDARYPRPPTWPHMWPYPFNPMTRIPLVGYDDDCDCCHSKITCACEMTDFPTYSEPLVEIRDYGEKGAGVRTLKLIQSGTMLAEYLGEIVPNGSAYDQPWNLDNVYGWEIDITPTESPSGCPVATIAAKRRGNWCRFVNHSCSNSLIGEIVVVGEKRRVVYFAQKDILPFEELTVHYGDFYFSWPANPCKCGEADCEFSGKRL